jgi:hypothetical protein
MWQASAAEHAAWLQAANALGKFESDNCTKDMEILQPFGSVSLPPSSIHRRTVAPIASDAATVLCPLDRCATCAAVEATAPCVHGLRCAAPCAARRSIVPLRPLS